MKWIVQNKKWAIGYLILIMSFSIPASAGFCQKLFSIDLLYFFHPYEPKHRIAQLDHLTLRVAHLLPSNDTPMAQQAFLVFKHPHLFNRYTGEKGLLLYAKIYFKGDIRKAKQAVYEKLSVDELLQKLRWYKYNGPIWDLNEVYSWQVFIKGDRAFRGMEGYALVANLYFDGDMSKAFDETLAMSGLDRTTFTERFGWKRFKGHTHYFLPLRRKITDSYGQIMDKYKRKDGLNLLAKEFYNGEVYKAFIDMKIVLNFMEFEYLQWPSRFVINKYKHGYSENRRRSMDLTIGTNGKVIGVNGHTPNASLLSPEKSQQDEPVDSAK